jgi:hydrogenase maturation protease
MHEKFSSDTVVIGVGNTILSDDGVGVHAVRLLQDDPRVPAGVTILDGGTLGLELLPYASDASWLLFLDAVNSGSAPGTPFQMTGSELLGTAGGVSVHQLGVADLIAALALVATVPQDIVVLGVQPANTDWGTSLSSEVEAALTWLVEAALAQLQLWYESRDSRLEVQSSVVVGPSPEAVPFKFSRRRGLETYVPGHTGEDCQQRSAERDSDRSSGVRRR